MTAPSALRLDVVDLLTAARFASQDLPCEIIAESPDRLVVFRFLRTPRFNEVLSALNSRTLVVDPDQVEAHRRDLRSRAIVARASAGSH